MAPNQELAGKYIADVEALFPTPRDPHVYPCHTDCPSSGGKDLSLIVYHISRMGCWLAEALTVLEDAKADEGTQPAHESLKGFMRKGKGRRGYWCKGTLSSTSSEDSICRLKKQELDSKIAELMAEMEVVRERTGQYAMDRGDIDEVRNAMIRISHLQRERGYYESALPLASPPAVTHVAVGTESGDEDPMCFEGAAMDAWQELKRAKKMATLEAELVQSQEALFRSEAKGWAHIESLGAVWELLRKRKSAEDELYTEYTKPLYRMVSQMYAERANGYCPVLESGRPTPDPNPPQFQSPPTVAVSDDCGVRVVPYTSLPEIAQDLALKSIAAREEHHAVAAKMQAEVAAHPGRKNRAKPAFESEMPGSRKLANVTNAALIRVGGDVRGALALPTGADATTNARIAFLTHRH